MLTFIKRAMLAPYAKYALSWRQAGHGFYKAEDYETFSEWLRSIGLSGIKLQLAVSASYTFTYDFELMLSAYNFKA